MKTLQKLIAAALLGASIANAQPNADIEFIQAERTAQSMVRPNISFQLPENVSANNFTEFYGSNGYFGKTTLDRKIVGSLNAVTKVAYGSEIPTTYLPGLSAGTSLGKDTFVKGWILPAVLTNDGFVRNKAIAGYFVNQNLPYGFNINSFGEIDMYKGLKTFFGEINLGRQFGDVRLSYNPVFYPEMKHRVSLDVKLK